MYHHSLDVLLKTEFVLSTPFSKMEIGEKSAIVFIYLHISLMFGFVESPVPHPICCSVFRLMDDKNSALHLHVTGKEESFNSFFR